MCVVFLLPCTMSWRCAFLQVLLVPRFSVVQGTRANGVPKVRPVDHFSWSSRAGGKKRTRAATKADSVNGHFDMPSTVSHDHLDDLMEAMRTFYALGRKVCLLLRCVLLFASFVLGRYQA